LIAIAQSAQEMRSPVESSMSISRGSGAGETSSAIAINSSSPCACRKHRDYAKAAFSLGDDPSRRPLDALRIRDRGTAELHDDRVLHV